MVFDSLWLQWCENSRIDDRTCSRRTAPVAPASSARPSRRSDRGAAAESRSGRSPRSERPGRASRSSTPTRAEASSPGGHIPPETLKPRSHSAGVKSSFDRGADVAASGRPCALIRIDTRLSHRPERDLCLIIGDMSTARGEPATSSTARSAGIGDGERYGPMRAGKGVGLAVRRMGRRPCADLEEAAQGRRSSRIRSPSSTSSRPWSARALRCCRR